MTILRHVNSTRSYLHFWEFSFLLIIKNYGKSAHVKLWFMSEFKLYFYEGIRYLKTMKNKRNLITKWLLLQNNQNADTT